MKRISAFVVALALVFGLSACGPTDKTAAEVDGVKIGRDDLFAELTAFLSVQAKLQGEEAPVGTALASQAAQSLTDRIKIEVERKALAKAGITVGAAEIDTLDEQIVADLEASMAGSFSEQETTEILIEARKVSRLFAEQSLVGEAFGKLVSDKAKPWFAEADIADYFARNEKDFDTRSLNDEARARIVELLHTPTAASSYVLSKAKVKVDKRFGTWDPVFGIVEPPVARGSSPLTPGIDLGG